MAVRQGVSKAGSDGTTGSAPFMLPLLTATSPPGAQLFRACGKKGDEGKGEEDREEGHRGLEEGAGQGG